MNSFAQALPEINAAQTLPGQSTHPHASGIVGLETISNDLSDKPLYLVGRVSDAEEIRQQGRNAVHAITTEAIPSAEDWQALPQTPVLIVVGSTPRHTEQLAASARKAGLVPTCRNRVSSMAVSFFEENTIVDAAVELFGDSFTPPPRKPRFKLIRRQELDSIPDPEWLIDGVLPRDGLGMLYGDPGVGKSFVALDLSASVAAGVDWHGRATIAGDALYLAAEGISGQKKRVAAWEQANGLSAERLVFIGGAVDFLKASDITDLLADIGGLSPKLIVVDTLARSMPGGDENQPRDMGIVIELAERLRQATSACILLIHHTKKTGGYRGSSSLRGAVSTSIEATKDGHHGVKLSCDKQRDADEFGAMRFKLEPFGASLVPMLQGTLTRQIPEGPQALVDTLRQAGQPLRNKEWREATGLPARTFNNHLRVLKENEWVVADGTFYRVPEVPIECHGTSGTGEDPVSAKGATPLRGGTLAPLPDTEVGA